MEDPWIKETDDGKFEVTNDGEHFLFRSDDFMKACSFAEVFKRFTVAFREAQSTVDRMERIILLTDEVEHGASNHSNPER